MLLAMTTLLTVASNTDIMNHDFQPRKLQVCSRCCTIKYPGPAGASENHKVKYCSDGCRPKCSGETLPPWPQPQGIFTDGKHFHPLIFLATVRDLFEKIVVEKSLGGDMAMEYKAFARLLSNRLVVDTSNGAFLFKLFDCFSLPPDDVTPDNFFVQYDGSRHLRVDSLAND